MLSYRDCKHSPKPATSIQGCSSCSESIAGSFELAFDLSLKHSYYSSTFTTILTRTLQQDGIKQTGVSLAFTVRQLDAGPIIAFERIEVDDQTKVLQVSFFWY